VIFQAKKTSSLHVDMELSEEHTTSASCMNEIGYLERSVHTIEKSKEALVTAQ